MKKVVLLLLVLSLCGCSGAQFQRWLPDFRFPSRPEDKPLVVDAEHAKVILQVAGDTFNPVQFLVRSGSDPRQDLKQLGTLVRPSKWDWRRTRHELQADPDQRFEVRGDSQVDGRKPAPGYISEYTTEHTFNYARNKWEQKQVANPTVPTSHGCGPLGSTFVPQKQKVYLVEFSFVHDGDECQQQVYDVTQAGQRIPVTLVDNLFPSFAEASKSP
ncbi:hypothetical protein [Pseudomonas gingeri]|uniref:hypothetical protein n=1 Tax=Pseudomonas gingeri TaxID=117681 RepID=UPI0015A21932|nr:hypothetical protein [Pseudomonas gingeri]NWA00528.1 hypothetical protein [Pseudomonas gingeri]NWA14757.1 hypothetical protein [Pseudomonas gingeri]NWA56066.1 hypothetical protein [Pseudomonas gingeri]NWA96741.1 hypothetical protein [Pseudomonas gingeri]NWB03539.1 hypothetical protein [Pseudomonas gingeri]